MGDTIQEMNPLHIFAQQYPLFDDAENMEAMKVINCSIATAYRRNRKLGWFADFRGYLEEE